MQQKVIECCQKIQNEKLHPLTYCQGSRPRLVNRPYHSATSFAARLSLRLVKDKTYLSLDISWAYGNGPSSMVPTREAKPGGTIPNRDSNRRSPPVPPWRGGEDFPFLPTTIIQY